MILICSECDNYVTRPSAGFIRAKKRGSTVNEGHGYVVCHRHADEIDLHPLEELEDGDIFILDERGGSTDSDGRLILSEPTPRIRILGYLTITEAEALFPNTYRRIDSKNSEHKPLTNLIS